MDEATSMTQDEAHMTMPELIKAHGYIPEIHHIWTEDGYCLNVYRVLPSNDQVPIKTDSITNIDTAVIDNNSEDSNSSASPDCQRILEALKSSGADSKLPVIVNHGLLSSSADWILLGPRKALGHYFFFLLFVFPIVLKYFSIISTNLTINKRILYAYVLCDNGFDVWLANARGNTYSKGHKHYSTKNRKFWDFSWHEIGYYDLPAMIDYILEKTGHSELYFIGHSQGTTTFYVMLSERPEYNSKIKGMISLAPIAFLSNQRSPLFKYLVYFNDILEWFQCFHWSSYFFNFQHFPRNKWQTRVFGTLVRNAPYAVTKSICNYWLYLVAGFGSDQLDKSMLPLILAHFPAGAAIKQIVHYGQLISSGCFQKYDYGAKENLKIYGSTEPPKYNLEKIKVPVAIFYSDNDFLTHYTDVQKLMNRLSNVIEVKKISYEKFNHIDYLWGRDARTLLYNRIVITLKKF